MLPQANEARTLTSTINSGWLRERLLEEYPLGGHIGQHSIALQCGRTLTVAVPFFLIRAAYFELENPHSTVTSVALKALFWNALAMGVVGLGVYTQPNNVAMAIMSDKLLLAIATIFLTAIPITIALSRWCRGQV